MSRLFSIVLSATLLPAPAVALVTSAPAQGAGGGALLVSTTSAGAAGALAQVDDADLVRIQAGAAPRVARGAGHWLAAAGLVPGDVDALGFPAGVTPDRYDALAFSLLSNEGGVLDGDVVTLAPGGGLAVLVPEADLAAALGAPGAPIDVDALAWDAAGRLCFSLQSDLPATALGDVLDGDVLRLETGGGVSRVLSEDEVGAALAAATGSSAAIGDVQGLAFDGDVPLVVVQSPSGHDGAVLACGAAPAIVLSEADTGLGGAELDGLALLPPAGDRPTLGVTPQVVVPGEVVQATLLGGAPGHPLVVMSAGTGGWLDTGWLPGFGALCFDTTDPWFVGELTTGFPSAVLDGTGSAAASFALPPGLFGGPGLGGEPGWTYQGLDLVTLELLPPFRVQF